MSNTGKKKKKKYSNWIDGYDTSFVGSIDTEIACLSQSQEMMEDKPPPPMILSMQDSPGFLLGMPSGPGRDNYVGIPQGTEGNIMVVGGNGSSKSAGVAKPTLRTWRGAICATDIKGELVDFYEELYQSGLVTRPMIVFDPMQIDGPSYDPFDWLLQDDEAHLVSNIWEISLAIFPDLPDDNQPFWRETERGVFAAALIHYFKCGLSFSETIAAIMTHPVSTLCKKLIESEDMRVYSFLGETAAMKPEALANIDRGLRNKLMLFAADSYINHAFRGRREGANCFTWKDLDTHNIFLRIPANRIEQWGEAINLMYTQLIRHLERRPEMHSPEGANNIQTLLLMDEFARFGKLEMITAAMATLRSKNVNICLMVQSVAQLDKIYGEDDRRIIFDNCQFRAILRANDAETQKYLCDMIGTHTSIQRSVSEHEDEFGDTTGYSKQFSESRDWTVQPHELAALNDVLLLTPYGFCRTKKFLLYDKGMQSALFAASAIIHVKATAAIASKSAESQPDFCVVCRAVEDVSNISKRNEGARIMPIEERIENANQKIQAVEQKQQLQKMNTPETQRRKDQRRNYIIGELVAKYFPDVLALDPGTQDENSTRFEPLEAFLYILSTDYDLYQELQKRAAQLLSEDPDRAWRMPT